MKTNYQLDMDIEVHDIEQLFHRAVYMLVGEGATLEQAKAAMQDDNGDPDARACLIQIIDPGIIPGCTILGTDVEGYIDL